MVCIHCGHETKVTNSRPQKRTNQIWRRRECLACGSVFTTEEAINYAGAWRIRDTNGHLQPFLPLKLTFSLYRSLEHRKTALTDATGLTQTIISKLRLQATNGQIDTATISQTVQVALNRFDRAASVHYEANHRS